MNRIIKVDTIIKHLPPSFKLPEYFNDFVNLIVTKNPAEYGFFNILWTNPQDFEFSQDAALDLIPFLKLGDGGITAFWMHRPDSIPIIHIDTEGNYTVSAYSFEEFILRIMRHKTGIPDIDEAEEKIIFLINGIANKKLANLNSINKEFKKWCDKVLILQKPTHLIETEKIRKRLYSIACAMLRKGISNVYTIKDSWWDLNFKIVRKNETIIAEYLDYGKWIPVPAEYGFAEEAVKLLPFTKSKNLTSFDMKIWKGGGVSINNDRELVLIHKE